MRWFKHRTDAHSDAKIRKVMIRYGAEGYALYWYCLELIAGKLSAENLTFELEHDAELIAHELRIDSAKVQQMMGFMVNLGLFEESENHTITCLKIAKHLDERFARTADFKALITGAKAATASCNRLQTVLQASADGLATIEGRREEKRREEEEYPPYPPVKKTKPIFDLTDTPPEINRAAWSEWVAYRKSKRKPISERAAREQWAKLSSLSPAQQAECIALSIRNDYQGLFPDKPK